MMPSSDWTYLAAQKLKTSRRIDGASTGDTDASTFKKLAMKPSSNWIYLAAQKLKTIRRIDGASTRDTDESTFKKLACLRVGYPKGSCFRGYTSRG